jgi:serine/threonine protein kinase
VRAPDGYQLGERFATDTTGAYWRATQTKLARPVTLKILREDLLASRRARELFLEERRIAQSLEHPNLLLTIDTGELDGVPWFITESTAEPKLGLALKEPMPELRAVAVALGIARALEYLERRQFLYKNLRPGNVLLPRPAAPKLVTFRNVRSVLEGAAFREARVQSGMWCAPELVRADLGPVTVKANVYALGAILYRMLAGVPPVDEEAGDPRQVHAQGRVKPLKEAQPYLRDRAHHVVATLMAYEPRARADAAAAVALLEAYANDPLVAQPLRRRRKKRR